MGKKFEQTTNLPIFTGKSAFFMQQSKLLELLRTLPPRRLGRFRDFLQSPYFNRSAEVVQFFDYMAPYIPDFTHKALAKDQLLQGFKTEKPLTEKRLAYLMNQLLGLAEEFMAIEAFRADPLEMSFVLSETLAGAGLSRQVKNVMERAVAALELHPYRNASYYAEACRQAALRYDLSDQMQHQFNPALQETSDTLDLFYLTEKLRYCLAMADMESILNLNYDWGLGRQWQDWEHLEVYNSNPTLDIYLTGIRMAREPGDTAHFYRQKALLFQHAARFNEKEQKLLFSSLLNYCSRRINQYNDQAFFLEYFDINKALLEQGLLFEDGALSPSRFLNLVNTGLQTGQTEWTAQFIREYRNRLPEAYAEDTYRMAMGRYCFHTGDYKQAQILLNQVSPINPQMAVTARNLLVRIYYETGETELLLSFLEAYRIYLLRQELLNPHIKKQARQFIDFTRRLAKIDKPEARLLPKLLAGLPPATEIYHRDWLAEQIEKKIKVWGGK